MISQTFPESNIKMRRPAGFEESQIGTIDAFLGEVKSGSCEGANLVVVAWKPTPAELEALNKGCPVFLSCLGGLPPHFLTTNFQEATNPA